MQTYNSYRGPGRMTYIKLANPEVRIETDGFTQQRGDKVMRQCGFLPEWEFEAMASKREAEEKKKQGLARLAEHRQKKQEAREARDRELGVEKKPKITKATIIRAGLAANKSLEEITKDVQAVFPERTDKQVKMQVAATKICLRKEAEAKARKGGESA